MKELKESAFPLELGILPTPKENNGYEESDLDEMRKIIEENSELLKYIDEPKNGSPNKQ